MFLIAFALVACIILLLGQGARGGWGIMLHDDSTDIVCGYSVGDKVQIMEDVFLVKGDFYGETILVLIAPLEFTTGGYYSVPYSPHTSWG